MVRTYGEIRKRIEKNTARLFCEEYLIPELFAQSPTWPGDWPGREILALDCNYSDCPAKLKPKIKRQLKDIIGALDKNTNEHGYFGPVFDKKTVDEQQLAGNSWFLRGLCGYYRLFKDKKVYERIEKICNGFLTGLKPFYENYPDCSRETGGVDGHIQEGIVNGWKLSSDVGCAFIMLDGITDVYSLTGCGALVPVIDAMTEVFSHIDLLKYKCQTHATLSATRGILRYYNLTGRKDLADLAVRVFDTYLRYGTTVNYANFNWFGRPTWTEPCAIVDSLIVAKELFIIKGDRLYAEFINRAYFNALRFSQRPNGGAGCETCLDGHNTKMSVHMYEASFCCTMRIAEGFLRLADNFAYSEKNTVVVPMIIDAENEILKIRTKEFSSGMKVYVKVKKAADKLKIYIPLYCSAEIKGEYELKDGFLYLPCESDEYEIKLTFSEHVEILKGLKVPMRGDRILFRLSEKSALRREIINCMYLKDQDEVMNTRLFL